MSAKFDQILRRLKSLLNEKNIAGMARFGIATDKAFGVKHPILKEIAREYRKDHQLALELWKSGYHEARLLATIIDDPKQVSERQAEAWVKVIKSWDICDGFTGSLIAQTPFAHKKAIEWAHRQQEFVRRAGFALMAWLPVHDKKTPIPNSMSSSLSSFSIRSMSATSSRRQSTGRSASLASATWRSIAKRLPPPARLANWIPKPPGGLRGMPSKN